MELTHYQLAVILVAANLEGSAHMQPFQIAERSKQIVDAILQLVPPQPELNEDFSCDVPEDDPDDLPGL